MKKSLRWSDFSGRDFEPRRDERTTEWKLGLPMAEIESHRRYMGEFEAA